MTYTRTCQNCGQSGKFTFDKKSLSCPKRGSTELKWDDVESEVCKRVIDMYGIVEEVKKRCKNFFGLTIDDKTARDLLWKAKERGYGWNADGALHIKQNEVFPN